MSPVDRACLYVFIFMLGFFVGGIFSAIREGVEKAAFQYELQKKILKDNKLKK